MPSYTINVAARDLPRARKGERPPVIYKLCAHDKRSTEYCSACTKASKRNRCQHATSVGAILTAYYGPDYVRRNSIWRLKNLKSL